MGSPSRPLALLLLPAMSALGSCGAGGTGGPSGQQTITVAVTLPALLLSGDTVRATVVLTDDSGNPVTRTVAWRSSDPTIASVDAQGRVAGGFVGGPVTITADAGKGSGSASIAVVDDTRFAYALADQPGVAGPYSPDPSYQFNSSGNAIEITRSATGVYSVRFGGLGRSPAQSDNVQVTGYSGGVGVGSYCKLGGWQPTGSDLVVEVRCFSAAGAAADGRYTVLVTGARAYATQSRLGFALSPNPLASGSLDPVTTRNSTSGAATVSRSNTGTYLVSWSGLQRIQGQGPETVMVTAVGAGPERCHVITWDQNAATASVSCNGTSGAAADSRFSVLWISRGRPGMRFGYAWTNEESSPTDYTPDSRFWLNSSGGTITAQRVGLGQYRLVFGGLSKAVGATETVMIGAYGAADRTCTISTWGNTAANELAIVLACFDPTGALADTRYDILLLQ